MGPESGEGVGPVMGVQPFPTFQGNCEWRFAMLALGSGMMRDERTNVIVLAKMNWVIE